MIKRAVGIVVLMMGCGGPQPVASDPQVTQPVASPPVASTKVTPQASKAPFEYTVVEKDEKAHFMGPQIVLTYETTNEVAKRATEDDLRKFWEFIQPTVGNRRAFIYLKTPVPGVLPWGVITRIKDFDGKWKFSLSKNSYGVDAEPYNFMDKIDRTKQNQRAMILTLPLVNRIVERLKRTGWTVKTRTEDLISAEQRSGAGVDSFDVTLTPEGIDLHANRKDDTAIFEALEVLTEDLGLGDDIKSKMQSVIGSPEYFRGMKNGVGVWHWTIRDYDVTYYHLRAGLDNVHIDYASNR